MSNVLEFYDNPSRLKNKIWSPNTIKARYALNYKGLPYKTIWVEFPDIEAKYKEIGATPVDKKADGSPYYTVPILRDHSTGAVVSGSLQIVEYLDKQYPDTPALIPAGTLALQTAFNDAYMSKLGGLFPFLLPKVTWIMNPRTEEFFRSTRLATYGVTMEEMYPKPESQKEQWEKLEKDLASVAGWFKEGDEFVMGDKPSYADMIIAGWLVPVRLLWGENSEEWKNIASWHGERWGRLVKSLQKHETVV
ncbi:hypothetical protein Moror_266 [Moniliophthora roreri MCA 2997]|uniref:GST N-terminal domain-containing protein n=2 Tax=Moniliophthora roreri TaxID=221103 RepID=V2Z2N0_MONRO|nr:hypothetical protein Moror_266 [Moniliophthora roreri MCA 2997]KAI3622515.1 hypothetical protein WG66_015641 [Moniliophthora roreri]